MRLQTQEFLGAFVPFAGFGEFTTRPPKAAVVPPSGASIVQTFPFTVTAAATTNNLTGVTTHTGNLVLLMIAVRAGNSAFGVSSIVDTPGNTYVKLFSNYGGVGTAGFEVWATDNASPAAIVAGVISITMLTTIGIAVRVFEISGAHNIAPLDKSASATSGGATGTASASGSTAALTAANQLTFGANVNDNGGSSARTFSGSTFTSAVPTTQWSAATTGDNSQISGGGLQLHSGVVSENATTGEAYSTTISTASEWACSCFSILNGP